MAIRYVRNTGSNTSPYDTWAKAATTLAAAVTGASAGDTIAVADGHTETSVSSTIIDSPGTLAAPLKILSVNDTGDPEPPTALNAGATLERTGGANISWRDGVAYVFGLTINEERGSAGAQGDIGTGDPADWFLEDCTFNVTTASSGSTRDIGGNSGAGYDGVSIRLKNCHFTFGHTSHELLLRAGRIRIEGGSIAATGTVPNWAFSLDEGHLVELVGIDLSAFGSGQYLFERLTGGFHVRMVDCKLGASVGILTGTAFGSADGSIEIINSDSSDTNYRFYRQNTLGSEQHETTLIRSGGATQPDGTGFARKIATTANVTPVFPYQTEWREFYYDGALGSSRTLKIPILHDSLTNLQNDEVWLEIEYPGTSGFPLGIFASNRISDPIFGTPADLPADGTSVWTTTGLTNPNEQALEVPFTPQEKGVVRWRVCSAKASHTVYYDPKPQVS